MCVCVCVCVISLSSSKAFKSFDCVGYLISTYFFN